MVTRFTKGFRVGAREEKVRFLYRSTRFKGICKICHWSGKVLWTLLIRGGKRLVHIEASACLRNASFWVRCDVVVISLDLEPPEESLPAGHYGRRGVQIH